MFRIFLKLNTIIFLFANEPKEKKKKWISNIFKTDVTEHRHLSFQIKFQLLNFIGGNSQKYLGWLLGWPHDFSKWLLFKYFLCPSEVYVRFFLSFFLSFFLFSLLYVHLVFLSFVRMHFTISFSFFPLSSVSFLFIHLFILFFFLAFIFFSIFWFAFFFFLSKFLFLVFLVFCFVSFFRHVFRVSYFNVFLFYF